MPVWLVYAAFASGGAYLGSTLNDIGDWWNGRTNLHAASTSTNSDPSWFTIGLYAAGGLALIWGARKAGLLK